MLSYVKLAFVMTTVFIWLSNRCLSVMHSLIRLWTVHCCLSIAIK